MGASTATLAPTVVTRLNGRAMLRQRLERERPVATTEMVVSASASLATHDARQPHLDMPPPRLGSLTTGRERPLRGINSQKHPALHSRLQVS